MCLIILFTTICYANNFVYTPYFSYLVIISASINFKLWPSANGHKSKFINRNLVLHAFVFSLNLICQTKRFDWNWQERQTHNTHRLVYTIFVLQSLRIHNRIRICNFSVGPRIYSTSAFGSKFDEEITVFSWCVPLLMQTDDENISNVRCLQFG